MSQEEKHALDQNKKIDSQLRNDKEKLRNEVKLLLLGMGLSLFSPCDPPTSLVAPKCAPVCA